MTTTTRIQVEADEVVGYRHWIVTRSTDRNNPRAGRLVALNNGEPWLAERAECPTGHRAPDPACHCGYYVFSDPSGPYLQNNADGADDYFFAYCLVAARGRIEPHPDGFRAEQVRPLAVASDEDRPIDAATISAVAHAHGVPVLERTLLLDQGQSLQQDAAHRPPTADGWTLDPHDRIRRVLC